jgi:hypothetical protein
MKKFISIFIALLIFIGCNIDKSVMKADNDMIYREIAWDSLSGEDKATVIHDWREAKVSECLY